MKWWFWLALELLVVFGVGVWAYFYPSEILAKGLCGFAALTLVGKVREILSLVGRLWPKCKGDEE